jgi:predicted HTH transcriptional regulator
MPDKKRIFISSVQKELELERAAVSGLIATDPFLMQHCSPILFEREPASFRPASMPYLDRLRECSVYVLLVGTEYGRPDGGLSATHHEYRLARELKLPSLIFLKGMTDEGRLPETRAFIEEIKKAGHTYKRFHDREDLKPEMLRALLRTLAEQFGIQATSAEQNESEHLIEAASSFETAMLRDVPVSELDQRLIEEFKGRIPGDNHETWSAAEVLHARGLLLRCDHPAAFCASAAALVLFGEHPAFRFPQCEILVDAYDDTRISGRPKGQLNVNAPLPHALEEILAFIDAHTFHPRRVVGLNSIRLNEYPQAAIREALLNAVAHRNYEDASRKVFVRLFSNRIEIASPGYPLKPITLAKLRKGNYRPCSRNPLIAQGLCILDKMEQRGTGFARMRDAMLNHGLDPPVLDQQDGFFVVTLPGPAGNYDRLRPPTDAPGFITPAMEARLNERQRRIVMQIQEGGSVTNKWIRDTFNVVRDTAYRDIQLLLDLHIIERRGRGRSIRYVLTGERA